MKFTKIVENWTDISIWKHRKNEVSSLLQKSIDSLKKSRNLSVMARLIVLQTQFLNPTTIGGHDLINSVGFDNCLEQLDDAMLQTEMSVDVQNEVQELIEEIKSLTPVPEMISEDVEITVPAQQVIRNAVTPFNTPKQEFLPRFAAEASYRTFSLSASNTITNTADENYDEVDSRCDIIRSVKRFFSFDS